jgi:hypothetical protein
MTGYADNFDHTKPFSDTCAQIALATNVAQTYTVPGERSQKYRLVITFNSTANVFVGYGVTALAPGAGLKTETGNMEFRPVEPKYVKGEDVISLVTPDASAYVGLSLLAIPG